MSKLAEIYKQAHDLVLKEYEDGLEDAWKVNAIFRHRLGEKGHETVMFHFVRDVENKVDKILNSVPVKPLTQQNKKTVEVSTESVKPTTAP